MCPASCARIRRPWNAAHESAPSSPLHQRGPSGCLHSLPRAHRVSLFLWRSAKLWRQMLIRSPLLPSSHPSVPEPSQLRILPSWWSKSQRSRPIVSYRNLLMGQHQTARMREQWSLPLPTSSAHIPMAWKHRLRAGSTATRTQCSWRGMMYQPPCLGSRSSQRASSAA